MPLTTQNALINTKIESAANHAGQKWVAEATFVLKGLLEQNPSFFCDDIWDAGLRRGDQPKALGQVIRNAVKEGWIEEIKHDNGVVALPSKSSHNQLKRVWKSNLYEGDQPVPSLTRKPIVIEEVKPIDKIQLTLELEEEEEPVVEKEEPVEVVEVPMDEEYTIPTADTPYSKYVIICLLMLTIVSSITSIFLPATLSITLVCMFVVAVTSNLNNHE